MSKCSFIVETTFSTMNKQNTPTNGQICPRK